VITSILDRFCVPLCTYLLDVAASSDDPPCDVAACIEWLVRASLFVTPLDNDGHWYRYHHLFQALLQRRLLAETGPMQVTALHRAAAAWFAGRGLSDEALHHALAADDLDLAVRLMQAGLCDVLNREDRATLGRWLRMLPEDFIERRPWLLMIKALSLQFSSLLPAVWQLLGQIEALIEDGGETTNAGEGDGLTVLRGLVAAFRSQEAFSNSQSTSALAYCAEAFALLPPQWRYARGGALMFWGMSMRATGRSEAAHQMLMDEYESLLGKNDAYSLRILFTVCLNEFETGNLDQVQQAAQVLLEQATLGRLVILQGWAHFYLGAVHYYWNELDAATHHFGQVVDRRYAVHTQAARNSIVGLVWVHLARAERGEAWRCFELLSQLDVERTGQERDDARSLRAQVEYLRGESAKALRWADAYAAPAPDRLLNWLQDPHLARARLLLARGADDDLQTALDITASLLAIAERNFSTRFQIDILSLRAVAFAAQGNTAAALAALRQAVQLASPGGFLRVFVDLGPPLQALLLQLAAQGYAAETVRRILAAFPAARGESKPSQTMFATRAANAGLADPLTSRELEVLALLPERLSIKEIAYRLGLAPTTVKRHTNNLYSKLGVNKRWDAVLKAETLGILPRR
jgi:LuxR family maltose regulon positive regulatory protein